jgi:hypothetical protein
MELNKFKYIKN